MTWKNILIPIALFLTIASCTSSPETSPNIIGTWRSDREKSAEYNEKHVKAPECTLAVYKQMMGNSEFEYRADGTVQLTQKVFDIDGCLNRKTKLWVV